VDKKLVDTETNLIIIISGQNSISFGLN